MITIQISIEDDSYIGEYARELTNKKLRSNGFKQQMKELVDIEVRKKMEIAAREISDYYYEQDVMMAYLIKAFPNYAKSRKRNA